MNIGITGHQERDGADWGWARSTLARYLGKQRFPIVGWSALAAGADQIFAQEVLSAGGTLHCVIPLLNYDECFESDQDRNEYHRLLKLCGQITQLEQKDHQQAFFSASKLIVEHCEVLIAIWDEEPSHGKGGTADVVHFANRSDCAIQIMNPLTKSVTPSF